MLSDLLWLLAVLGAVFWIVLPAAVLVLAVLYRPKEPHPADNDEDQPARG